MIESIPTLVYAQTQEKWTSNDNPYLYLDLEKDTIKDPWKHCYDTVDKRDDEICKDLQDEIGSLLVIVSVVLDIYVRDL
jgi:hypothetical protein